MRYTTRGAAALMALIAWSGGLHMAEAHAGDEKKDAAAADEPTSDPEPKLPEWRKMWNFGDPAGTEAKFLEARAAGEKAGDTNYVLIVTTQIARTHGLRRDFDKAHEILDGVEAQLDGASAELRIRYRLERGRAFNSSGSPKESVPYFEKAWDIGVESGEDMLAIDAAHMLAIALPGEEQLPWSEKAIALAESSKDERCRNWLGPLYNNTGWTYHDLGKYERALELWVKSLAFRKKQGAVNETFIARWAIARCWRSMERYEEAIQEQLAIIADRIAAEMPSKGYCEEELGECLWALDRKAEAKQWFAKAYDLLKDDKWMQADEPERLARMKELGGR